MNKKSIAGGVYKNPTIQRYLKEGLLTTTQVNKLIVEEQLKSEEFNETQKEIQQKTLDAGAPVPIYDINSGYYSISFTPVAWGNSIFVHNHITGKSFKLFDYEDFQEAAANANEEIKESPTL